MSSNLKTSDDLLATALTGDTHAIGLLRAMCRRSLYFFVKTVICQSFCTRTKPNLMTPAAFKESCDWVQAVVTKDKRGLLEDPRAHIKSFRTTIALPPWLCIQKPHPDLDLPEEYERALAYQDSHPHLRGPDSRLGIASESKKIAIRWNAAGKQEWISNPVLRCLFPEYIWPNPNKPTYGSFASEAYFLPGRHNESEANPFCRAIGLDSKESGGRLDGLIVDDLVSEDSYNSPTELARRCHWLKSIQQLMENADFDEPGAGFILVVENRWALDDPNTMIHTEEEFMDWQIWRRSAFKCYVHGAGNCGRWSGDIETDCADSDESIWPERYPDPDKVRQRIGDIIFDIQWRNNPTAHSELDASKFVPFEMDLALHEGRREWMINIERQVTKDGELICAAERTPLVADGMYHLLSIDPAHADDDSLARKKGKTARHCMSWFCLDTKTDRVYNLAVWAGHWGPDEAISRYYEGWMFTAARLGYAPLVLCEKVGAQVFVNSALRKHAQLHQRGRGALPNIEGIPRKRGDAKVMRAKMRIGVRLNQYRLFLLRGIQLPRHEVRHFPNSNLDWCDSYAQADEKFSEKTGLSSVSVNVTHKKRRLAAMRHRAGEAGLGLG